VLDQGRIEGRNVETGRMLEGEVKSGGTYGILKRL